MPMLVWLLSVALGAACVDGQGYATASLEVEHEAPAMVCHSGTVCAAAYSGNGQGCCPYAHAVCCPNKQTCCPAGTSCNDTGTYLTQCVPTNGAGQSSPGRSVCKPGAHLPLSTALPNVLIIGDSVSIGYTPPVAARMANVALVQHSPWDVRDGGAEETACESHTAQLIWSKAVDASAFVCRVFAGAPDCWLMRCLPRQTAFNALITSFGTLKACA